MDTITPKLLLIGESAVNRDGMTALLEHVGAYDFSTDAASGGEEIAEVAGRMCYLSFAPGINPNVTRVREGNQAYIGNILKSGHGSVLEHATVNFAILDVTPVLTHELVRHSVGTAISQTSGRFCRIEKLGFYWPKGFEMARGAGELDDDQIAKIEAEGVDLLNRIELFQRRLGEITGIDRIASFAIKKILTSAFRRFAPYGLKTSLIFSANHRAIRHIIASRTDIHAEEEIRAFTIDLGHLMKERFPAIYQDMALTKIDAPWGCDWVWKFEHHKV